MLSFMREQGIETNKQGNETAAKPAELPGTLPASPTEQYLTVAHKKQVRKSNLLLVVLFCAGLLGLWFMIKKSTPQTAAASVTPETQIEALLAKFAGARSEMFSSLDEIANRFYKFAEVYQVRNEDLVKNPFRADLVWANSGQPTIAKTANYTRSTETAKQAEPAHYASHMQLLSIMSADARKCCMIDDKILYEGDSIKEFKVRQIGDNFVKLEQKTPDDPNSGNGNVRTEIILKLAE